MRHDSDPSRAVLSRTPAVLRALLAGLGPQWTHANDGPDRFSPFDVVGHLIHGERTDWLPRTRWIREKGAREPFPPFDRFAQAHESRGKTLGQLLDEFEGLRGASLGELAALKLTEQDLDAPGMHPTLGAVTLRQLLATWVVHDLNHVAQIARAMAFQYKDEVGPWRAFLPILPRE
jgi:hypothetical protein